MKDYQVKYIDKCGNHQNYEITSTDVRTAMSSAFELRPEIKQIIRCVQKPMFEDS